MCFDKFCVSLGLRHSGWRKASKCKRVIKEVWSQLKIEKNKINSLVKQSRAHFGQLLKNNQDREAFAKVELLYKYMCLMSAYDKLDHFSVHVYNHLPTISKDSVLPTEVSEAVSSLIYAAPRCFKLHSLQLLRNLFEDRYGSEFVKINTELLPGNLVNVQIKEHLCMESVPDDVILNLISIIASDHNLNQTPEDITQRYKLQHKKAYHIGNTNLEAELEKKPCDLEKQEHSDTDAGGQMQISEFKKMPRNVASDYSLYNMSSSTQIHDVANGMGDVEESSVRTTSKSSFQKYFLAYLNGTGENLWVQESCDKEDLSSLKSCDVKRRLNQFENSTTWVSFIRKEMEYAMYDGEPCEDIKQP